MRFLMVTTFYPPWSFGGDAVMVQQLAHGLAANGHEVTVAHSAESHRLLSSTASPPPAEYTRRERDVRLVALDTGLGPAGPLAAHATGRPALVRRRFERLLEEGFDVVHFHNPSLLGAPGLFRLGRAIKLVTLHDFWLVCQMHSLLRNGRELCERPACVRCALAHHRPPQLWRYTGLLERSLRSVDALLAPSRTAADLHAALRPHVRIESLPNFVHPDPWTAVPQVGRGERGRPYFLYAGRLEPTKGVARAIDAFERRSGQDLVIAGSGTLEVKLRQRAATLPNIHFTGHLDRSELDNLYRGAQAVVIPSIGHETCGLTLLESHAHGVPVIASNHGAMRELVRMSGGGLLFADADELDASLGGLAEDDPVRSALARRARAAYLRNWTLERHLSRYLELVGELTEARLDMRAA